MADEQQLQMHVPESVAGGVLADFVAVGQNGQYFTLDFAAITGQRPGGLDAQVVSRVKVLPDQVFQLMRALNEQLAMYEQATGSAPAGTTPPDRAD